MIDGHGLGTINYWTLTMPTEERCVKWKAPLHLLIKFPFNPFSTVDFYSLLALLLIEMESAAGEKHPNCLLVTMGIKNL